MSAIKDRIKLNCKLWGMNLPACFDCKEYDLGKHILHMQTCEPKKFGYTFGHFCKKHKSRPWQPTGPTCDKFGDANVNYVHGYKEVLYYLYTKE